MLNIPIVFIIKGKFRIKGIKSTNPIAVGDIVDYELEETSDAVTGTIHKIHDRKNYIVRKSVNLSHQMHIIASNIDRVFLLVTINNPPTTFNFIGEFNLLYSLFKVNIWYAVVAGTTIILGAFYMLRMFQKVMLGSETKSFKKIVQNIPS